MIGLFAGSWTGNLNNPFWGRSGIYKKLLEHTPDMYAFTPKMVDSNRKRINALTVNNGKWIRKHVPFPTIVYERTINRLQEKHSKHVIDKINPRFVFNGGFFSKILIHNILKTTELNKHIPEMTTDRSKVKDMLNTYGSVYVKPDTGSFGRGIEKITSLDKNYTKGTVYQRTVDLIRQDDAIVDFRVHLVKNGTNIWDIVCFCAKKAGKGNNTTHFRTGGKRIDYREVINYFLKQRIENIALETAIELERTLSEVSEMAIDIGVDTKCNIFIFEVNSKPGFHAFNEDEKEAYAKTLGGYCSWLLDVYDKR